MAQVDSSMLDEAFHWLFVIIVQSLDQFGSQMRALPFSGMDCCVEQKVLAPQTELPSNFKPYSRIEYYNENEKKKRQ